jgi:hypothetical protein
MLPNEAENPFTFNNLTKMWVKVTSPGEGQGEGGGEEA